MTPSGLVYPLHPTYQIPQPLFLALGGGGNSLENETHPFGWDILDQFHPHLNLILNLCKLSHRVCS